MACRDVTHYTFTPHYGGHVPVGANLADLTNELGALPAYTGLSALGVAPVVTASVFVAETKSRTFGVGADTVKLQITGYDNTPDPYNPNRAMLVSPSSPLAKQAVTDNDVLAAIDAIRADAGNAIAFAVMSNLSVLNALVSAWSNHLTDNETLSTHGA